MDKYLLIQGKKKNPGNIEFPGFLRFLPAQSALAELRGTAGGLEAVLFTFLHPRIAGQETGFLQGSTEIRIRLAKSTADAMPDGTGLTRQAAAIHVDQDIKSVAAGKNQRLPNGHLKRLQSEILINIALVNGDLPITGNQSDAGNGLLPTANCAIS